VTKKELLALIEAQRERIDALEQRLAEVEAQLPLVQVPSFTIVSEPLTPKPELPDAYKPWVYKEPWVQPLRARLGDSTADGGVSCDEPTARLLNWLQQRAD
jgi:hypothetical protein